MKSHAPGLVRRYLDAVAQLEALIKVNEFGQSVDEAISEEAEAQSALVRQVKMATGRCPSSPVQEPIAAALDHVLVVVAPDQSHDWDEVVFIIQRRNIASGE